MERRSPNETVAANIRSQAEATGRSVEDVSKAAGVPTSKLNAHPSAGELTWAEVVKVSGLLCIEPEVLFEGVAA